MYSLPHFGIQAFWPGGFYKSRAPKLCMRVWPGVISSFLSDQFCKCLHLYSEDGQSKQNLGERESNSELCKRVILPAVFCHLW